MLQWEKLVKRIGGRSYEYCNEKIVPFSLLISLVLGLFPADRAAAATPRLQKKSVRVEKGKSVTVKVKGSKKKAKWSVKSGKKNVRLVSKKKASVKIQGKRKGTAKVQCKLGKKKLICKVTVTERQKKSETTEPSAAASQAASEKPAATGLPVHSLNPSTGTEPTATTALTVSTEPAETAAPTVSPEPTASGEPSAVPTDIQYDYDDYVLKIRSTPGPIAEYDRLKVEIGLHKEYLDLGHYAPETGYDVEDMQFFETGIWREDIEIIHISNTKNVPDSALGSFDLSEKQNGSVMAWYSDQDGDGRYEMTIGQDGGVIANENSSYLFSQINMRIQDREPLPATGLENLDTSHVTNMSFMFADSNGSGKEFSLGDKFDTSKVTDMSNMFFEFM